ncbi:MAG: serine hydrolase [Chryseolinea sp.]
MIRLCFIAIVLSMSALHAQPVFIKDSLEQYILRGMDQWQIPGLAIAIVKDGQIVHMKGYGVKDIKSKEPVDENTLFMIGSNTKVFTATALTILEQQKKLSLDDKVTKWLPYFKLKDPLAGEAATVRDLLSHRIGFETFQGDFVYWASTLTRKEVIGKMALIKAPYGFRAKYGYCNAAFAAAGEVVPAVTGQAWEDFIRENILKPLKMNHTQMLVADLPKASNIAVPYTMVANKLTALQYAPIDNLAPAGTMSSSAKDMVNWLKVQIDFGMFEGQQVIPKEAIVQTRMPQSIRGLDQRDKQYTHFRLYGLGTALSDRDGKLIVGHTGGVDGFLSSVMIVPEDKLGIVVLTNTDQNGLFQNLTNEIRDAYLNLPYVGYSNNELQASKKEHLANNHKTDSLKSIVAQKNKSALPLASYVGKYTNAVYGDIALVAIENKLKITFSHHPNLTGSLDFLKDNSFLCTYSVPTYGVKAFPFHVKDGKITGFTLTVSDFVEFTPYEFVRN